MFADVLFYMFAGLLLLGGVGVITARNPVFCVLFLIFTFLNAAGLFMLLQAEFIALLLVMVYVGAIAVMFLFTVMTINIDYATVKQNFVKYTPLLLLMGIVLAGELIFAIYSGFGNISNSFDGTADFNRNLAELPLYDYNSVDNIVQIGNVLFTNYVYPFIAVSVVLLIAMVGAIILTKQEANNGKKSSKNNSDKKSQDVSQQVSRKREDCIELLTPKSGEGIK